MQINDILMPAGSKESFENRKLLQHPIDFMHLVYELFNVKYLFMFSIYFVIKTIQEFIFFNCCKHSLHMALQKNELASFNTIAENSINVL